MAPIIGNKSVHFVVGEDLTVQRDCCSKQELEAVLGREVTIFHAVPLNMGMVSRG